MNISRNDFLSRIVFLGIRGLDAAALATALPEDDPVVLTDQGTHLAVAPNVDLIYGSVPATAKDGMVSVTFPQALSSVVRLALPDSVNAITFNAAGFTAKAWKDAEEGIWVAMGTHS